MRKKISLIMFVVILIRLFCLSAVASDSDQTFTKDFSTEERENINRYGLTIDYQDFTIPVKRAEWNVNTYHYEVTMGFVPEGEPNPDSYPFTRTVTVYNHSDLPIYSTIEASLNNGAMLEMTQTSTVQNGEVISGSKVKLDAVQEGTPLDTYFHQTEIVITPTNGWESFINTLIANGATNGSSCTVGSVTIAVTKN